MLKAVVALLVATTVAAFTAVIFSLDAVARTGADRPAPRRSRRRRLAHDHTSRAREQRALQATQARSRRTPRLAQAHKPYDATLPPLQAGES